MRLPSRKAGAALAIALACAGVAAMGSPASAADPGDWVAAVGSTPLLPGDTVGVAGGTLSLTATFDGVPGTKITCTLPPWLIKIILLDPVPGAPSGEDASFPVTLPPVISSSDPTSRLFNVCNDTFTGAADDVATDGSAWTLDLTAPPDGSSSPFTGHLAAKLDLSANSIDVSSPAIPDCVLSGPTDTSSNPVTGDYNAATGELITDSTPPQTVPVAATGSCTVGPTATIAADLDIAVGPNSSQPEGSIVDAFQLP